MPRKTAKRKKTVTFDCTSILYKNYFWKHIFFLKSEKLFLEFYLRKNSGNNILFFNGDIYLIINSNCGSGFQKCTFEIATTITTNTITAIAATPTTMFSKY